MKNYIQRFVKDENGAEIIEYAIVIGIVAVLVIALIAIVAIVKQKMEQSGELIGGIDVAGGNNGEANSASDILGDSLGNGTGEG